MAIFWALSCMILAALNDLVFKFYARKPRSQGYFVSIVGGVWMITGMCFVRQFDVNWQSTILWGAISGFFSVGGNLLMLDAMRSLDAGVCSTIYRLNLVPVTIGAAVLLGEKISLTPTTRRSIIQSNDVWNLGSLENTFLLSNHAAVNKPNAPP